MYPSIGKAACCWHGITADVKTNNPKNGIAVNVVESLHSIDWSGVKSVEGYWERRTVEAIEIRRSKSSMNLDKGLLLPSL